MVPRTRELYSGYSASNGVNLRQAEGDLTRNYLCAAKTQLKLFVRIRGDCHAKLWRLCIRPLATRPRRFFNALHPYGHFWSILSYVAYGSVQTAHIPGAWITKSAFTECNLTSKVGNLFLHLTKLLWFHKKTGCFACVSTIVTLMFLANRTHSHFLIYDLCPLLAVTKYLASLHLSIRYS